MCHIPYPTRRALLYLIFVTADLINVPQVRKLAWHVCFVDTHGSTGCLRITTLEPIGGRNQTPLTPCSPLVRRTHRHPDGFVRREDHRLQTRSPLHLQRTVDPRQKALSAYCCMIYPATLASGIPETTILFHLELLGIDLPFEHSSFPPSPITSPTQPPSKSLYARWLRC